MSTAVRRLAAAAHIVSSVGWLGAVAAFLVLAIAGLTCHDPSTVRAAYIAMELIGWFVIVPLCFASFGTGLALSLGTSWGLFRHYWVVAKLVMTVPSTLLLLVHMQSISHLARVAAASTLSSTDLAAFRIQSAAQAGAALFVLFVATILSIYKPPGMTRYGWNKRFEERVVSQR